MSIGDQLDVTFTITNVGGIRVVTRPYRITVSGSGHPLFEGTSSDLEPGEEQSVSHRVTIPSNADTGQVQLWARLDRGREPRENRDNNEAARTITVSPTNLPDLTITHLWVGGLDAVEGDRFRVSFTIENIGVSQAASCRCRVCATPQGPGDCSGCDIPALAPGESWSASLTLEMSRVAAMAHFVAVEMEVDSSGMLTELDESNNTERWASLPR